MFALKLLSSTDTGFGIVRPLCLTLILKFTSNTKVRVNLAYILEKRCEEDLSAGPPMYLGSGILRKCSGILETYKRSLDVKGPD